MQNSFDMCQIKKNFSPKNEIDSDRKKSISDLNIKAYLCREHVNDDFKVKQILARNKHMPEIWMDWSKRQKHQALSAKHIRLKQN